MNSKGADELLTTIGQRIRLHVLICEQHRDLRIVDMANIIKKLSFDYNKERPQQIYIELRYSMYIPYASILVLINTECKCGTLIMRKVLKNLKLNPHLRYKTKMIYSCYIFFSHVLRHIEGRRTPLALNKFYEGKSMQEVIRVRRNSLSDCKVRHDLNLFRLANADNTFFMRTFSVDYCQQGAVVTAVFKVIQENAYLSLHELFMGGELSTSIAHTNTKTNLYFYSINPALAIIINNYYFTNTHHVREGSEQDVRRLIRELKIAQIPFILIQDSNREELLQILDYMRRKNVHPLKSFLFFLMSHGDANNVIYTHDGQVDLIEDVVRSIQSNESLKDADKVIVVTSCRGPIDMEYADRNDLKKLKDANKPSASCDKTLANNTVILRSVPELVVSPRDPECGTPFIASFCQSFRHIDHMQDIRLVHNRIENYLQNAAYYEYLEKRSDLIMGSTTAGSHCLIRSRINAQEMVKLMQSIRDDFPAFRGGNQILNDKDEVNLGEGRHHQQRSLFYICGSLKKIVHHKVVSFPDIYFSRDLDKDKELKEFQGK